MIRLLCRWLYWRLRVYRVERLPSGPLALALPRFCVSTLFGWLKTAGDLVGNISSPVGPISGVFNAASFGSALPHLGGIRSGGLPNGGAWIGPALSSQPRWPGLAQAQQDYAQRTLAMQSQMQSMQEPSEPFARMLLQAQSQYVHSGLPLHLAQTQAQTKFEDAVRAHLLRGQS